MRRVLRILGLLLTLIIWMGVSDSPAAPRGDQCVILVSIDGLAHFYLDDRQAEMPTIRRLAREGARADGVISAFPSVTWPAHTTMATGASPARNGMVGNSYIDRTTGEKITLLCDPVYDKDQVVRVPAVYDVVHQAGLKTAAIVWPATRNARTLDWTVPDMPGDDTWDKYGTKSWLAELRKAGIPVDRHGPWVREASGGVQRDWLYVRMAGHVLRQHQPNLLLIHLVEPDHVQHRYGPRAPEAYWCARYADDCVRQLIEAVDASPWKGKTTLFVCSDHGFLAVRRDVRPNVLLRKLGLITEKNGKIVEQSAVCHSQGGAAGVYVLENARRAEIAAQLRQELAKLQGVEAVFGPEEYSRIGQPTPEQNPWGADLWIAAQSGCSFSDTASGDAAVVDRETISGTHGYLPDQPDMLAMCVVWGPGIRPGTRLGKINSMDIAPTIAAVLGLEMPSAEGKVLTAITGR
jgi:predicted AlkP superfamily pyrophosphatase or phosphodiesterase